MTTWSTSYPDKRDQSNPMKRMFAGGPACIFINSSMSFLWRSLCPATPSSDTKLTANQPSVTCFPVRRVCWVDQLSRGTARKGFGVGGYHLESHQPLLVRRCKKEQGASELQAGARKLWVDHLPQTPQRVPSKNNRPKSSVALKIPHSKMKG